MNLAEFPLTVLSTRANPTVKTLEFRDSQRLKSGEILEREWIITGADKFGLPTATDDDVVLGLIRLTMDRGFRERKIYFTRYELLRILRWSTEGRSYGRLTKSLDRLSGVRIRATNSFFDNSSKAYQTCNFGIIDAYEINDERANGEKRGEGTKSFFIWSEALFDSFRSGFIKKLDMDLYLSLRSAVARRLYRFLDKHFYYRATIERPLLVLAYEKLGLSRNYTYLSQVKQQIEPACEELVEKGFLERVDYSGYGNDTYIRFVRKDAPQMGRMDSQVPATTPMLGSTNSATNPPAVNDRALIIESLLSRGLTLSQAGRLLAEKSVEQLKKIEQIIKFYDLLVERKDPRIGRNRIGYLYRAVETPDEFNIPTTAVAPSRESAKTGSRPLPRNVKSSRPELKVFRSEHAGSERSVRAPETSDQRAADHSEYHRFIETELERDKDNIAPSELSLAYREVEEKMRCFKAILDPTRYKAAVESCLKEELARIKGLPSFHAWSSERKRAKNQPSKI